MAEVGEASACHQTYVSGTYDSDPHARNSLDERSWNNFNFLWLTIPRITAGRNPKISSGNNSAAPRLSDSNSLLPEWGEDKSLLRGTLAPYAGATPGRRMSSQKIRASFILVLQSRKAGYPSESLESSC